MSLFTVIIMIIMNKKDRIVSYTDVINALSSYVVIGSVVIVACGNLTYDHSLLLFKVSELDSSSTNIASVIMRVVGSPKHFALIDIFTSNISF